MAAKIKIRNAAPDDYDAIIEVWQKAGLPHDFGSRDARDAFLHQLRRYSKFYLVAFDGPQMVGTVFGTHDERKGWINRLAVVPSHRRLGVGTSLAHACIDALRSEGIAIVAALVEDQNSASCALFERLGFQNYPARYYRRPLNSAPNA